jgi:Amt family ammonium transporter
MIQAISVIVTILYVSAVTFILAKLIDAWLGLRVSGLAEEIGLDLSEHGERAYS